MKRCIMLAALVLAIISSAIASRRLLDSNEQPSGTHELDRLSVRTYDFQNGER
jgi:hypothetical protein